VPSVLILFDSRGGLTEELAQAVAEGVHLLLAHGMVVVGLPWSERMRVSGSYYGATAVGQVTDDDRAQARELGRSVAELAVRLAH